MIDYHNSTSNDASTLSDESSQAEHNDDNIVAAIAINLFMILSYLLIALCIFWAIKNRSELAILKMNHGLRMNNAPFVSTQYQEIPGNSQIYEI